VKHAITWEILALRSPQQHRKMKINLDPCRTIMSLCVLTRRQRHRRPPCHASYATRYSYDAAPATPHSEREICSVDLESAAVLNPNKQGT